jgi:DNA repair protein RadC
MAAMMELARRALTQELRESTTLESPQAMRDLLKLQIGSLPHEVFTVLYLDNQHQLIALEELFRGTLTQTSVYPREVVLRALHHHAAAVVLAHNHPCGAAAPSSADEMVTRTLRSALGLIDVRVLDHFILNLPMAKARGF